LRYTISTIPAKSSKYFASFNKKNPFQNHPRSPTRFGISLRKLSRLKNPPRKLSRKHICYITHNPSQKKG
ncbi:hypothetical protein TSAR_001658, partial [Trichomalopsis sarcophagae]